MSNMKSSILITIVLIVLLCGVNGARILAIFTAPAYSHNYVYKTLIEELAKKGHSFTIITPNPMSYVDAVKENITQYDMHHISYETYKMANFVKLKFSNATADDILLQYYKALINVSDVQFSTPALQKLLHDESEHFDLVISEGILPFASAFKVKFNCPLILISSAAPSPYLFDITGNPDNPALYGDCLLTYDPMETNLYERTMLIWRHKMYKLSFYYYILPKLNKLAKKYFGDHIPSLYNIENDVDLVFVNHNPVWNGVRPLVPTIIGISNIHLKPGGPLPHALKTLLDEAEQGFIYMSFGTSFTIADIPKDIIQVFLNVLKQFPYKVLWKLDNETVLGTSDFDNIYISSWFPQMSILAHPNIKVFITQGGQQSVEEAIFNRVPIMATPFFLDQMANGYRIEKNGIGRSIKIEHVNKSNLKQALLDIISNTSYRHNMEKLHNLLFDQPMNSLENAVWWTEYVIRHNGTKHLRSQAAYVNFITYHSLDVLLVTICLFGIQIYIVIIGLRYIIRKCKTIKQKQH